MNLSRSFEFFNGCRVAFVDDRAKLVKFGLIMAYDESSDDVDIWVDGEGGKTVASVPRYNIYKYDYWKEKKPVSDLRKLDWEMLVDSEKAPMPPLYFTRKMPCHWDLTLVRASWLWCKYDLFPAAGYPEAKKLKTPTFFLTTEPGVGGVWKTRENALGIMPKFQHIRDVTVTVMHEVIHQLLITVKKDYVTWHGKPFDDIAAKVAAEAGIPKKFITVVIDTKADGSDASTSEDMEGSKAEGGKIKGRGGKDVDIYAAATKKFWIIVVEHNYSLLAIRTPDDVKGLDAVSYLNNLDVSGSRVKAAMYYVPYAAMEYFHSQASFGTKFWNNLMKMTGVFIKLTHENGKLVSKTPDVIGSYVKRNPDYMASEVDDEKAQ